MKKLKLEDLEVTTFEAEPGAQQERGTLNAHQMQVPPSRFRPCYETDPNFDCTFLCSHDTCPNYCIVLTDVECA